MVVAHQRLLESARLFRNFFRNISRQAVLDIQVKNLLLDAVVCVPAYLYFEIAELVFVCKILPSDPFKLRRLVPILNLLVRKLLLYATKFFDRLLEAHLLLTLCEQRIS